MTQGDTKAQAMFARDNLEGGIKILMAAKGNP